MSIQETVDARPATAEARVTDGHRRGGAPVVIRARGLSLTGRRGPVYGPLDLHVRQGQLVALAGRAGSGRTSLLLTLAGRMKADAGDLTVLGQVLRSGQNSPGRRERRGRAGVQRDSAVALVEGVDEPDEALKVMELLSEGVRLQLPGLSPRARGLARDPGAALAGLFDDDEIPEVARARVWQLGRFDVVRLRIAMALLSRPALLCVDDVATLHSPADQSRLWSRLRAIADGGTTVIAATSNTATIPADVTRAAMNPPDEEA